MFRSKMLLLPCFCLWLREFFNLKLCTREGQGYLDSVEHQVKAILGREKTTSRGPAREEEICPGTLVSLEFLSYLF